MTVYFLFLQYDTVLSVSSPHRCCSCMTGDCEMLLPCNERTALVCWYGILLFYFTSSRKPEQLVCVFAENKTASRRPEAECCGCIVRVSVRLWRLWLLWCLEIRRCESPNLEFMAPMLAMTVVGSGRRLTRFPGRYPLTYVYLPCLAVWRIFLKLLLKLGFC